MSEQPTVKTIVLAYLSAHGFEGLWSRDGECGCEAGDLMPCGAEGIDGCRPGYRVACDESDSVTGHDWHISETREAKLDA